MVWISPMTFTDDTVLTYSQMNNHLRDAMLETMPAKATQASTFFAVDRNNHLVERNPGRDSNQTSSNRNNTEYGDLNDPTQSPTVTRTTGPTCLVMWRCQITADAAGTRAGYCSIEIARTNSEIGGATDDGDDAAGEGIEPQDKYAICIESTSTGDLNSGSAFMMFHNLTGPDDDEGGAFEYQFSLKYRTVGGAMRFDRKSIFVWPFS